MAGSVAYKLIKPAKFNRNAFVNAFKREAEMVADDMRADFEKTTKTWKPQDAPVFEKIIQVGKESVQVFVGTDSRIYNYVNNGTSVRYAQMSKDYSPKTKVGVIGSTAGSGRMIRIDTNNPRPGIKARKFDEAIQKLWSKRFKDCMVKAMQEGVKACGHEVK